jgi:hypothetical protein
MTEEETFKSVVKFCSTLGFNIITTNVYENKKITIKCTTCDTEYIRTIATYYRWSKHTHGPVCNHCIKIKQYDNAKTRIAAQEQTLISLFDEFKQLYGKIKVRCKCGTERVTTLSSIELNRGCYNCMESSVPLSEIQAKTKATTFAKYGVEFASQSLEFKTKIKKVNLEKYGVEHASQTVEFQNKIKSTNLKKYGVEHVFQVPEVKEKIKESNRKKHINKSTTFKKEKEYNRKKHINKSTTFKKEKEYNRKKHINKSTTVKKETENLTPLQKQKTTNLKRYGVEYPGQSSIVQAKMRATTLAKYGAEHMLQVPELKAKRDATMLKKYGATQCSHVPEILDKICHRKTIMFELPNKKIVPLQGYEPRVLHWILNLGKDSYIDNVLGRSLTVDDLVFAKKEVPEIWYTFNDKRHRYYVDFSVPKSNSVYEIKSPYTLGKDWDVNISKINGALEQGLRIVVIIWYKTKLIDCIEFNNSDTPDKRIELIKKLELASKA